MRGWGKEPEGGAGHFILFSYFSVLFGCMLWEEVEEDWVV